MKLLLILLAILAAGYVLLAWTAWRMDIRQPAPRDSDDGITFA